MKRFFLIVIVLLAVFGIYWFVFKPKPVQIRSAKMTPVVLKKHSDGFIKSVNNVVLAYLDVKNAFIESDTINAKQNTRRFIDLLGSIPIQELKKDTSGIYETVQSNINDIKANAASLLMQANITEMRRDFSMVTEMMYPSFFKAINYEGPGLYLENCPMAFGEDQPANWISNSSEIVNPYLGKNHPEFKATMLHCGSVKDSIKGMQ